MRYLPFRGAAAFSLNIHMSNLVASGMKTFQVGIGNQHLIRQWIEDAASYGLLDKKRKVGANE
jgi:hypothetical protein